MPSKYETSDLFERIGELFSRTPNSNVGEITEASELDRLFMTGFVFKIEEKSEVASRKAGPARIYFGREAVAK